MSQKTQVTTSAFPVKLMSQDLPLCLTAIRPLGPKSRALHWRLVCCCCYIEACVAQPCTRRPSITYTAATATTTTTSYIAMMGGRP